MRDGGHGHDNKSEEDGNNGNNGDGDNHGTFGNVVLHSFFESLSVVPPPLSPFLRPPRWARTCLSR